MTALSVPATKFHDLTVIIGGKYRSMMIKVKLTQKKHAKMIQHYRKVLMLRLVIRSFGQF